MRRFLWLVVVSCGGSSPPPSSPPEAAAIGVVDAEAPAPSASETAMSPPPEATSMEPTPPPPTPPVASSTPTSKAGCVEDAKAKAACSKKGKGFHYGPQAYVRCSGVAPRPGEMEETNARIRSAPCECVDEAAVAKRAHNCRTVPSAPPGPKNGF